jgi:hypothetical protein
MKQSLLRNVLLLDGAVLLLVGGLLILFPTQIERAFQFNDLPQGVSYIVSSWGCALATLAIGYAVAATDPVRHIAWVQVGIARGALECIVGVVYLLRGVVQLRQAGVGLAAAATITVAYIVLYPRPAPRGART